MLGLGWTEMLVIGVMALIFIGPKDLPVVMNRIGKIVGQVKRMGNEFQREINKTTGMDEVRNLRNSITSPLKKTADEIRKEFNAMTPTGAKPSGVIKPANPAVESVVDEIKAKAGMTAAAAPLTADEAAKAAGFKPAGPAPTTSTATFGKPAAAAAKTPVKTAKAPARAKAAPTSPVASTDLPPVAADTPKAAAPKPVAAKPGPAKPAAAKADAAKADATKADAPKAPPAKKASARKPAGTKTAAPKPALPKAAADGQDSKPAPKKRAAAKPKADTTATTAAKAGNN